MWTGDGGDDTFVQRIYSYVRRAGRQRDEKQFKRGESTALKSIAPKDGPADKTGSNNGVMVPAVRALFSVAQKSACFSNM